MQRDRRGGSKGCELSLGVEASQLAASVRVRLSPRRRVRRSFEIGRTSRFDDAVGGSHLLPSHTGG